MLQLYCTDDEVEGTSSGMGMGDGEVREQGDERGEPSSISNVLPPTAKLRLSEV